MTPTDSLRQRLVGDGYSELRVLPSGPIAGLLRYVFTWGLVVGLARDGYQRRYCYEHRADALADLLAWDGKDHPSGPWIKCKGSGIDLLNPKLEMTND